MDKAGAGYSRAVIAVKLLLPLVAVGILSLLFLFARGRPDGEPLRFVEEDAARSAQSDRLGAPTYTAVTADGSEIRIVASEVRPDDTDPDIRHGRDLVADIGTPSRDAYRVVADRGRIELADGLLTLRDEVRVTTDTGYTLLTDAMRLRTDRTYLESLAPVSGDGPAGTIDADRMEIFNAPGNDTGMRVVFTGDVRVVYDPRND